MTSPKTKTLPYGLTAKQTAQADKRVEKEVNTARRKGAVRRFDGTLKSLFTGKRGTLILDEFPLK